MSKAKLQKFIDSPINFQGVLIKQPILIGDSKGNYLKSHSDLFAQFGFNLDFECRGGARFVDYYYWLQSNLYKKVNKCGSIVLYIFLGTCDLTIRKGKFIELRHSSHDSAVSYLIYQIDRFRSFIARFPSVSVVFLEIPPYSIQEWNKSRGHRDPKSFLSQDLALYERLCSVNEHIKAVNDQKHFRSPRFNLDLRRTRKSKGDSHRRVSINFSCFKDGVHPNPLLARFWLKKIIVLIIESCDRKS